MKQRPDIIIPGSMDIPLPASETLPNGVPLHVLVCSDQAVVRVCFVFRAGALIQEVPFSASTTSNMLAEGSARHTAQ